MVIVFIGFYSVLLLAMAEKIFASAKEQQSRERDEPGERVIYLGFPVQKKANTVINKTTLKALGIS